MQDYAADSLVPLYRIRQDILADSLLNLVGEKITAGGIASIATGILHERYLQVFIQNDSVGLSLFGDSFDQPISPGDSVVATGKVQRYFGLTEIYVEHYRVFDGTGRLSEPVQLSQAINFPAKYEGMLISGEGVIRAKGNRFNGKYLMVAPADTSLRSVMVYVSNFHSLYQEFNFEILHSGDDVRIKGILSSYDPNFPSSSTFKILLRTPSDLQYADIPTFYRRFIVLGISVISVLVLGWILLLKKQVSKQTSVIRASLREKEILLQEIHHRVKNNLAIVSGLIELQLDSTADAAAQQVLKDSQVRIQSMALVHEELYKSATLSKVDMDGYIRELVKAIHQTFVNKQENVKVEFRLEPVKLDIQWVIPCGLLINELVVNAFKHAFKECENGRLVISFRKQGNMAELMVADNGPGLPEGFLSEQGDSLGIMLIHTFADQLSAEIELTGDEGASFLFRFPLETA